MPFLTINGVTIPVARDSVEETSEDIGEVFQRGLIGSVITTRTGRLRTWRFTTRVMKRADAEVYRSLIEGQGQYWAFHRTGRFSSVGVTAAINGTYSFTSTGGPAGSPGFMTVNAGSRFGVRMQNKLGVLRREGWDPAVDGYTLAVWRRFVDDEPKLPGWHHVIVTGATPYVRNVLPAGVFGVGGTVAVYVDGVVDTLYPTPWSQISTVSPFVALFGFADNNAGMDVGEGLSGDEVAIDYADLLFLPYRIPAEWAPMLKTESLARGFGAMPRVHASGLFFGDKTIDVICRVKTMGQLTGDLDGSGVTSTNRTLDVEMTETI